MRIILRPKVIFEGLSSVVCFKLLKDYQQYHNLSKTSGSSLTVERLHQKQTRPIIEQMKLKMKIYLFSSIDLIDSPSAKCQARKSLVLPRHNANLNLKPEMPPRHFLYRLVVLASATKQVPSKFLCSYGYFRKIQLLKSAQKSYYYPR